MAVTSTGPLTVTWHGPVPLHEPPQLTKAEVASGVAVSVTTCGNFLVSTWKVQFVVLPPTAHELSTVPLAEIVPPPPSCAGAHTFTAVAFVWKEA
jgi:hypothetical protein